LKSNNIGKWARGDAISARAIAFGNLGQYDDAVREYNRAIETNPEDPILWENRASYWDNNSRPDLAASDRQKGREIRATY
jgi:tetratricopeptide (TPR) repeat protein